MARRHGLDWGLRLVMVFGLLAVATPSPAGFGDALKKKFTEKAEKKANEAIDKAGETGKKPADEPAPTAQPASADATAGSGAAPTKVAAVSTKFDFVPGDKVIVADDFTQDELGEFPTRFRPQIGTFEIAEMEGERWLRCMSADGTVRLRIPDAPALPEYWTLEFDFFGTEPMESALTVKGVAKGDHVVWEASYPAGNNLWFSSGDFHSSTPLEGVASPAGRHHVMLMARGTGLKVYLDRQRLANDPELSTQFGPVASLDIRLWATSHPMITNVRYAEGCKPAADLLAQGKLVTYGIRFATGSDVVLPESAPILRQIAAWLTANPAAKLSVTGHTDNVGSAASNLDLSKRRSAAVARVLSEQFAIAPDRLSALGKGDTQPVTDNAKPEGRAMNRRVEFARMCAARQGSEFGRARGPSGSRTTRARAGAG